FRSRESRQGITAIHRAEFGTDKDLASGIAILLQPALEHSFGEGKPLLHLPSQIASAIGDGNLSMVAVEWTEMKLLRPLDQVGPDEEPRREVFGNEVFDHSKM